MKRGVFKVKARKPLKRSRMAVKGPRSLSKPSKASLWEQYSLKRPAKPRYSGLKGIYWYLFSQFVRRRDFHIYNGECIDQCGKKAYDWHDFDAGHFNPASKCGFGLLFHEQNVNGQLKGCNNPVFSPHSFIGYEKGLDKRYGKGTSDSLKERRVEKEWSEREYDIKIRELQEKLKELDTQYRFNPC